MTSEQAQRREAWLHELRHDVNGPLGTVKSVLALLRQNLAKKSPEEILRYLQRSEDQITEVQQRVDELIRKAP